MRDDYDEISCGRSTNIRWDQKPGSNYSSSDVVTMPRARYEHLKACLRECAEDLKVELDDRYGIAMSPTQQRRYVRDMAPVERAFELLGDK